MSATRLQAQKIVSRCFEEKDFEFLQRQPKFIEATRQLETIEDALSVVDLGGQLIRQSWKRVSYPIPPNSISL